MEINIYLFSFVNKYKETRFLSFWNIYIKKKDSYMQHFCFAGIQNLRLFLEIQLGIVELLYSYFGSLKFISAFDSLLVPMGLQSFVWFLLLPPYWTVWQFFNSLLTFCRLSMGCPDEVLILNPGSYRWAADLFAVVGLLDCWTIGLFDYCTVDCVDCWLLSVELLDAIWLTDSLIPRI